MKNVLMFVLGAAAGSLVTWKLIDEKYKRLAKEEIEEVREYYKGKSDKGETVTLTVNQAHAFDVTAEDISPRDIVDIPSEEYATILSGLGYSNEEVEDMISDPDISIEMNEDGEYEVFIEPKPSVVAPYVISPDEYGDEPGYDAECWTLYADGILTDDDDQIVGDDELELFIGDGLDHFGDYEDDSVHVRNEGKKCDIEVLRVKDTYDESHGGEN